MLGFNGSCFDVRRDQCLFAFNRGGKLQGGFGETESSLDESTAYIWHPWLPFPHLFIYFPRAAVPNRGCVGGVSLTFHFPAVHRSRGSSLWFFSSADQVSFQASLKVNFCPELPLTRRLILDPLRQCCSIISALRMSGLQFPGCPSRPSWLGNAGCWNPLIINLLRLRNTVLEWISLKASSAKWT